MIPKVLLVGNLVDPHVELIASEITDLGGQYDLLDESTLPYTFHGFFKDSGSKIISSFKYRGKKINIDDYSGVYLRHIESESWQLPSSISDTSKEEFAITWMNFLRSIIERKIKRVINPIFPSMSNFYKIIQLNYMLNAGFHIPKSIMTSNPTKAKKFLKENSKVIVKSGSGVRSIVRNVKITDYDRLYLLHHCPALFQQYVEGMNVRVHCVGKRIFPVGIKTDSVDYRYSKKGATRIFPLILPADIKKQCITLNKLLGLNFSGIDLILTKNKKWYGLEVNPDPAFLWFQRSSGLRISRGVAKYLMGK